VHDAPCSPHWTLANSAEIAARSDICQQAREPIAVAIESDFGTDRIWRLDSDLSAMNPGLHNRLVQSVIRFGVADRSGRLLQGLGLVRGLGA
jgi:hypothetical protein